MHALVRPVPFSFSKALTREPLSRPLDPTQGREQHFAYCSVLKHMGFTLIELPKLEAHPDSCFVEDCAVVAGGVALLTRPGAPSRRGEVDAVGEALGAHLRLERMSEPATLDGGDCLRIGRRFYVGRSARTNAAGVARLREVFSPLGYEVLEVAVEGALHLKSVCSAAHGRVLLARGTVPPSVFARETVVLVDDDVSANVVEGPDGAVLASTAARLELPGVTVRRVDNSELRRADSALTCLCITWRGVTRPTADREAAVRRGARNRPRPSRPFTRRPTDATVGHSTCRRLSSAATLRALHSWAPRAAVPVSEVVPVRAGSISLTFGPRSRAAPR
ncbi:MAG: hypothetical protein JNK82_20830 [Myxococcaceae bacterium]|nr:hypothetical protein [Myxococcaceae bacterium]